MTTIDSIRPLWRKTAPAMAVVLAILSEGPIASSAAEPASPTKVAEAFTATERQVVESELRQIQQQLTALQNNATLKSEHLADAQIFVKGVVWALDFGPLNDTASRDLVQKALRRAKERTDALASGRHPWVTKRGRTVRGFISEVDGSTQPYGLVVPESYDPAKPMRLDVVLHGSRLANGIGELVFMKGFDAGDEGDTPGPNVEYIEVHPLGRLGENAYRFEGETDVDEAIEVVCRNYRVDRNRIVLRGSSLGGVGTWQLGLKRPDRFVALGPTAGPVDTCEFAASPWPHFVPLEPLTGWQKKLLHLVDAIDYTPNAGTVPVVAVMGDKDPYFSSHLLIQKAFERERIPFVGLIDRGAGHGVTDKARQDQLRLIGERAANGMDPAPQHIRFVTWTLKYSRCHWIEILGLKEHYQRAEIDAHLAKDGSLTVTEPINITRFVVRPPALQAVSATLTVGTTKIELPTPKAGVSRTVVVDRDNGTWKYRGDLREVILTGKRPGLQGPIDDAFATRFLCVRGTGTAWNPAIGAWADASLNRFADEWRRHYRGDLPLKKDTDVTPEDLRRSNLILFGDPGSNSWIREIVTKLPLQWTRDQIRLGRDHYPAADHGVQLIYPSPFSGAQHHYVVLNSGHTYHDQELRFSYMVFPRLGDWAILKAGDNSRTTPIPTVAETVLESGFFDEGWNLPVAP